MEYTYTICFLPTGQFYHGSKVSKDADPEKFWIDYFTSSNSVKKLISEYGVEAFSIIEITAYPDGGAYDAETKFLQQNNCAESDIWLNLSNNDYNLPHNSEKFRERMFRKYGVYHNSRLTSSNLAQSRKMKENWNNPVYRQNVKDGYLKSFGYNHPMYSPDIKEKVISTCLERYGVTNVFAAESVKAKIKETFDRNYNGKHPKQTERVRDTCRKNSLERHGVEHFSKTDMFKEKIKDTWKKKDSEEVRIIKEKSKNARANDPILECPHCGKMIKNLGLFNRWHGANCKLNENSRKDDK